MTAASGRRSPLVLLVAGFALVAAVMVLVEPPFIGADELYHWQRAAQIADGGWLGEPLGPNVWGGTLDRAAFDFMIQFFLKYTGQVRLDWDGARALAASLAARPPEMVTMPFPSTATFSPLAYLPQAFGIVLARAGGLDVMGQSYVGRLMNLAGYVGLLLVIWRLLPWGGAGLVMVACIPAMLHVAGTLSADPLNFTLPLLLVAIVLRVRTRGERLRLGVRLLLPALCIGIALLKPTLVLVTLVLVLLPRSVFAGRVDAWVTRGGCIALAVAVGAAWNAAFPFVPGRYWNTGADPAATIALFRADPMEAVALLGRSLWAWAGLWVDDLYGRFGGHAKPFYYHSGVDALDWIGLGAVLATAALLDRPPRRDLVAAGWLAALGAAYAGAVVAAFAVGFTKPGDPLILGVQGRYFAVPVGLWALAIAAACPWPGLPRRAGYAALALASLITFGLLGLASVRLAQLWSV